MPILCKVEAIVSKTKIKHPKAKIIELDGTKYIYYSYFDRGFDDDGLDRVWDKCSDLKGVVDVGFGYGYGLENTKYENSLLIELDDDVIVESKKSARNSIKESLNIKDYCVEVYGDWFKEFYSDFDEFKNDLLYLSEGKNEDVLPFTYDISPYSESSYVINAENDYGDKKQIVFVLIPKPNKSIAKELNNLLH